MDLTWIFLNLMIDWHIWWLIDTLTVYSYDYLPYQPHEEKTTSITTNGPVMKKKGIEKLWISPTTTIPEVCKSNEAPTPVWAKSFMLHVLIAIQYGFCIPKHKESEYFLFKEIIRKSWLQLNKIEICRKQFSSRIILSNGLLIIKFVQNLKLH